MQAGNSASGGHVAVIDIGSNSIRLVVYESLSRAPLPRFNEKSLCELGRELRSTGKISERALECAANAVHRFCAIAKAMQCERIDLLATEALRKAENGEAALERLTKAAGRPVRILQGEMEAYLAARGVLAGLHAPNGLVGDLGGGSLDLAEVALDRVTEKRQSISIGTLSASEILTEPEKAPKKAIDSIIAGPLAAFMPPRNFYLVGGSWRALARVHMAMHQTPVAVPNGYSVDAREMRDFAKSVWRKTAEEAALLPSLPSRRAKHIRGAALLLDRVLKALRAERVTISSLGLREGWLFELLPADIQKLDPLIEGAKAFGGVRARVPAFAQALVRWTDKLLSNEDDEERRWRIAACQLSDIAWADHRSVQAQLAMRRILQFPFVGVDHRGRAFMAACIHSRYGGDLSDPAIKELKAMAGSALIGRALILGRAMLTGHRLSGSVPELLDRTRLVIERDAVVIEVSDQRDAADSDAVRQRLGMLAKAIGFGKAELKIRRA